MKKGQSTLEYVFLIGVGAAALIAMLVYIGRGLQGNLRNQAEQLGAQQYAPGKTTIHNTEIKVGNDKSSLGSSTTTVHGNLTQSTSEGFTVNGVQYPSLDSLKASLAAKKTVMDNAIAGYQAAIKSEGEAEAAAFSGAGSYPGFAGYDGTWKMPQDLVIKKAKLQAVIDTYNQAVDVLNAALNAWAGSRTPDKTTSGSSSSESGSSTTTKKRNEALGDL
jgi:hypothetical protein